VIGYAAGRIYADTRDREIMLSREYVEQMVGIVPGGHADVLAKAVFFEQLSEVCIDGGGVRTGAVDVPRQQQSVGVGGGNFAQHVRQLVEEDGFRAVRRSVDGSDCDRRLDGSYSNQLELEGCGRESSGEWVR
jgi:hypothetical protein